MKGDNIFNNLLDKRELLLVVIWYCNFTSSIQQSISQKYIFIHCDFYDFRVIIIENIYNYQMLIYEKILNFWVFNFLNIVENNKIVNKSCVLALKITKKIGARSAA